MTQEEMESTLHILVDNQARFYADLELIKENQQRTDAQILALTERVDDIVGAVDVMRLELRESFENLIIANEVTRNLAEEVGKLAITTSQRVTKLEQKIDGV